MKGIFGILLGMGALATAAGATTYYVDDTKGNDSAAGTSEAAPWQSLDAVNRAALGPGDRVLFRRGGLWRGMLRPKSGNGSAPLYYGAYGTGPKPILEQSVSRSNPADWFEEKPGLWSTRYSLPEPQKALAGDFAGRAWTAGFQGSAKGSLSRLTEDGFTFNRLTCQTGGAGEYDLQLWGPALADIPECLIAKFRIRSSKPFALKRPRLLKKSPPWTLAATGKIACNAPDLTVGKDWQTVDIAFFRDAAGVPGSFQFALGGGLLPEQAVFDFVLESVWSASAPGKDNLTTDIGILILNAGEKWGVKKWKPSDLLQPLDYWYDAGHSRVLVRLDGNPAARFASVELAQTRHVIEEGGCHDVTYEGLAIRYTGSHGIGGGNTRSITIRGCDIYWIGGGLQFFKTNGRPVRFGNGIEFWGSASHNLVEGNRLWEIYDAALTNQGRDPRPGASDEIDITYRDNVIWNAEYSFEYWNNPESAHTERITFEHNTCVDSGYGWAHVQRPDPNGAHLMFYVNLAKTSGVVVRDNIFCRTADRGIRMFNDWRAGLTLDRNLYFTPGKPVLRWLETKNYSGDDFAAYQKELGLDAHSLYAEPQFVNPAARDYRLKPGTVGTALASDGGAVGARPVAGISR